LPGFAVPLTISVGLLEACTQGGGVATNDETAGHLGFSESSASVANVVLGTTNLGVLSSQCRADGNGARGSTTVVGAPGIPTNPPVGFIPQQLPAGLLSLVLNEQIVNNTPGTATITVNAAHANILGIDIIIGQSVCRAFGPDVNVTTTAPPPGPTTTSTAPPPGPTTTTTACPSTGCPTTTTTQCPSTGCPTTTTTACPSTGCPTTTTTRCPTPTCPTPTTACPAAPSCPTPTTTCPTQASCASPCHTPTACPTTTLKVGALVRTGSDNDLKVAWAAMALTLGGLFLMGSKGLPGQTVPASGPSSGHTPPSGDGRRRSRRETAKDIFREMRRFK
jgi:hypothetical protein